MNTSFVPLENAHFKTRLDRAQFVCDRFKSYIQGNVLDVGCDYAHIKKILNLKNYIGIDFSGEPDMSLDLDKIDRLPFDDNSFSCVICCEVLEHLNELHFIFNELVRVSSKYVLISLPNNWTNARRAIEKGKGHIGHYGLPFEKPVDRHKWFFSLEEAKDFLVEHARRNQLEIIDRFATAKPRHMLANFVRKLRYPNNMTYLNRYAHTYWCLMEKKNAS